MVDPDQPEPSKRVDVWALWAVRLGVILSLIAIIGAVIKVGLYGQELQEKERRRIEAARLYLDGTPSTKDCAEAATTKRAVGCFLVLKAANPEIRLLRTMIDYPAAASPCGCSGAVQIGTPVPITLDRIKSYLVSRTYTFTRSAGSKEPLQVNLPIVISTEYDYKGVTNVDISSYYLTYRIIRDKTVSSVIPEGLIYCGRLPRIPTFVIDPWISTEAGRKDQRTSSVLVECLQKATWFDTPRGRYRVTTDIAADAVRRGGFEVNSVPAFVKETKFQLLEGTSPQVTTAMITG